MSTPNAADRSQTSGTVLVTGATGPHGRAVAAALLSAGWPVRALTRDPSSARARALADLGAEPVAGDMNDRESLLRAMHDTAVVYAVTTPFAAGPGDEIRQGEALIAAASEVQIPWLMIALVASADRQTGVPHFDSKATIERRLRAASVPHTILAPTYFFENLGDPAKVAAIGELALALPAERPLQQIALTDLGALVAAVLRRRSAFLGERIELAGDRPTPQQMADTLSRATDRPVRYRQVDIDHVAARSDDLTAMYRFLADTGYDVDLHALHQRVPEVRWTSFADWVRQRTEGG